MSEPAPQQPRRRRQHKRSRNGCYTCKQRHIRCDEQTPICTNCLVRGGACGYPNGDSPVQDINGDASGNSSETPGPASVEPVDPQEGYGLDYNLDNFDYNFDFDVDVNFDVDADFGTPYDADYQSYFATLLEHLNQFQLLTRCLPPKSPDTTDDRAHRLLASMHYAWVHGALGDTEQAYLCHKGEAIREVNTYLHAESDTKAGTTRLMAALALAEMGIGDADAAHAHLNGLVTLLQWQSPDGWHEQLQSLFDGIILGFVEYLQAW